MTDVMAELQNCRMAEWQNGRLAGMAEGIHIDDLIVVLRQNGRMAAEWWNGQMAEWQEWQNGIWNGGMTDGMAEWQNGRMAEWQNGGNGGRNG